MDIRQLRYFAAVAEHASFSEAAARLNVAQSALSRHTQALEGELGVPLFRRHARGVELTDSGALLLERARRIFRELDDARAEAIARARLPAGEAVIGTTSTTSRILYGPLAERFASDFPNVQLRFVEGVPYHLLEGIDTGRIDLAVMVDPEPRSSLVLEPLVTEQVYLIGALDARGMPSPPCDIRALDRLPMILLPRPAGSRVRIDRATAEAGITLDVRYEVANVDVAKDFVARGLGFALLPHSSVTPGLEGRLYRAVPVDGIAITRTLLYRADRPLSPAVRELARLVRAEIARQIEEGLFGTPPAADARPG
jgi:LysR family nitrogen assimilation transcriptional regulator